VLDAKQGLMTKEVYDMVVDEKGYLYAATQFGFVKYDGERFYQICKNIPLSERIFYAVKGVKGNLIYAANSHGKIYQIDNEKAIQLPEIKELVDQSSKKGSVVFHLEIKGTKLYAYTFIATYCYDLKSKKTSKIERPNTCNLSDHIEKNGNFRDYYKISFDLNATKKKIWFIQKEKQILLSGFYPLDRLSFVAFKKRMLFLNMGKLYVYELGKLKKAIDLDGYTFLKLIDHQIYAYGIKGLVKINWDGTIQSTYLKNIIVDDIVKDNQGITWISTNKNYIFQVENITDRNFKIPGINCLSILDNKVLLGTINGELLEIDNLEIKLRKSQLILGDLLDQRINAIHKIDDRYFVVSTVGSYFTDKAFKFEHFILPKKTVFYDCIKLGDNHFIGHSRHVILRLMNNRKITYDHLPFIREMILLRDSIILFGTDNGIVQYDYFNNHKVTKILHFFDEMQIQALAKSGKSNSFFIGTRYNGLYLVSEKNRTYKKVETPFSQTITQVKIHENHLFVASNKGLFVCVLNQVFNHPKWILLYDSELIDFDLLKNKVFIAYTDNLIIKEWRTNMNNKNYKFYLNQILQDGQLVTNLKKLTNETKTIEFDFDILNYRSPSNELFYQLSGQVNSKSYIKNTTIRFEGLRSGNYKMVVYPVIHGQIDFSKNLHFAFKVPAAYWEQTSFLILLFCLIALTLYSFWAYQRLIKRKRLEKQLAQTNETLNYKLTALKSQINPHFMSNSLAAIQGLILKNELDASAQYLAKFSYLMRQVLNLSEEQFITLKNELEIIDLYLELEQLRFKIPFKIIRNYDENLEPELIRFPSLITQPALENAIWHGLRKSTEKEAVLTITIRELDSGLIFEISDNGAGIDVLASNPEHQSKGRNLIIDRISSLNKLMGEETCSVEFIDLKNQLGESGTCVKFFFSTKILDIDANN